MAGESVNDRLMEVLFEKGFSWFVAAVVFCVLTLLEWARFLFDMKPNPIILTAVTVPVCALATVRIRRALNSANALKLGRDGERSVAETMQDLVRQGWHVFHDVPGDNFNIDHVAVGRGGIFAIETKTRRKPTDRDAQVVVGAAGISIDGGPYDRAYIDQTNRQAKWLVHMLRDSTERTFPVQPVLLFPGWFINDSRAKKKLWILEPKGFVKWAARSKSVLQDADIALVKHRLDSYLRNTAEKRG
jgi:hypothetical protein